MNSQRTTEVMNTLRNQIRRDDYGGTFAPEMHCELVALEISIALIDEGKKPFIVQFKPKDGEGIRTQYSPSKQNWIRHVVCVENGIAYEPYADEDIPIEELSTRVYGREIPYTLYHTADEIRELVA